MESCGPSLRKGQGPTEREERKPWLRGEGRRNAAGDKAIISEGQRDRLTLWARPRLGVGERKNVYFFDLGLAFVFHGKSVLVLLNPPALHGHCPRICDEGRRMNQ